MLYADIYPLVTAFKGSTFATVDVVTTPSPGIIKTVTGAQLLLFAMPADRSGYEALVKRRLKAEGKNPDNFAALNLPWGEKLEGTPLILHKGNVYLQGVVLDHGKSEYKLTNGVVIDPVKWKLNLRRSNQGLSKGNEVVVVCYNILHIHRLAMLKQTVGAAA